jgi:hypothetical protein
MAGDFSQGRFTFVRLSCDREKVRSPLASTELGVVSIPLLAPTRVGASPGGM